MEYVKVKSFDTNKIGILENCSDRLIRGDIVVVEDEEKGEDVVRVIGISREEGKPARRYIYRRKATVKDLERFKKNMEESKRAFKICKEKIKEHGLDMHLLKAYIPLNAQKVFFYYTAEQRVDFRQLVRDLAKIFKRRIEMRHVGVRDAIQILGWIGLCGNIPCCMRFIEQFESISLRDIEEQNLPLSPSKFTGPCGRLVCCMAFERENYLLKVLFPEKGTKLCVDGKEVTLLEVDPLRNTAVIEVDERKKEINATDLLPKGYERALEFCRSCKECCRRVEIEDYHETAVSN